MSDRIEKSIDLKAPVSRVWRALTDYREFNAWFHVDFDRPFEVGQVSRGHVTYPGYEHKLLTATVKTMKPETEFAYTWHPGPVDPTVDYTKENPTLVEFRLEPIEGGTRLRVTESGFDGLPAHRRADVYRANDAGWPTQLQNLVDHVAL